jgi:hypothetical protein
MRPNRTNIVFSICTFLVILLAGTVAFAASGGSPELPPGVTPGGGGTTIPGTQLTGELLLNFTNFHCSDPTGDACAWTGPDVANVKATLRLNLATDKKHCDDAKNKTRTFNAFLGKNIPIDDVATVQAMVMAKFKGPILKKFFGVHDPVNPGLNLYLQDVSPFNIDFTYDPNAPAGTFIINWDTDPAGLNPIIGFTNVVDVVVVVGP